MRACALERKPIKHVAFLTFYQVFRLISEAPAVLFFVYLFVLALLHATFFSGWSACATYSVEVLEMLFNKSALTSFPSYLCGS